jgi:nitrogen regulatory protein PII-like uncharacterized protein
MNINVNEIITLHDNTKYVVLAETLYHDYKYYYLVEVAEDGEDIKDSFKIMKEKKDADRTIIVTVTDESELEVVSKLLGENLKQNELEEK